MKTNIFKNSGNDNLQSEKENAEEFLKSKIGFFNSYHPVSTPELDYEDIINYLVEYAEIKLKNQKNQKNDNQS